MLILKEDTTVTVQFGPFVDKGDGVTLEIGLGSAMDNATTGIRLSKNGGTLADRNESTEPAYDAMGFYKVILDATDTDTPGTLLITFEEAATTLPGWQTFMIMPANAFDSLFGSDKLQVDTVEWIGGAIPAQTQTGVPEVDVTFVAGVAEDLPTATALATAQTDLDTLTDARSEPAQGAPPVSATTNVKVDWLYKTLRNKKDSTATLIQIYNDDTSTVDYKRTISDDATTYTEEEIVTGP